MANVEKGTDLNWLPEYEQRRQDYADSLVRMTVDDLADQAMESYPRVGYVDLILQELRMRTIASTDEAELASINELIEHIQKVRERMLELLNASDALSRQTILPEQLTVHLEDGGITELRFSAFELADTGQLTGEGRIVAALKERGIIAGVNKRACKDGVGVSEWIETPGSHQRGTQHLGAHAHLLATETDPTQAL